MFDIGWVEMMIVVVVMVVVIGPKDLPVVLHTMGKWIARVQAMARHFQDSIEEMAEESGLDRLRGEVQSIRDYSLEDEIIKVIDPEDEPAEKISVDPPKDVEFGEGSIKDSETKESSDEGKGTAARGEKT